MKCLLLLIVCLVSLCKSNEVVCPLYDESTKIFEIYCKDFKGEVPERCANQGHIAPGVDVKQLKIGGCDNDVILDTISRFNATIEEVFILESDLQNMAEIIEYLPAATKKLSLSGNFVGKLNASTFERLKDLTWLQLKATGLEFSDFSPFDGLDKLMLLDISNNDLAKVDFSKPSKNLGKLQSFFAANCHIQDVAPLVQHFGADLQAFTLAGNPIGSLRAGIFDKLSGLSHLDVSSANLQSFDFGLLEQTKIQFLNISNNHLSELELSSRLPTLLSVHIQQNNLTNIDNVPEFLPGLISAGISQNLFTCDYLKELTHVWKPIFTTDPFDQKGKVCKNF